MKSATYKEPTMPETYLSAADYAALVARLLAARDTIDPENEVKVLLGELASIWPESIEGCRGS